MPTGILAVPKHYNTIICQHNTCIGLCKSECTNRLKLQFLSFSTSFHSIWYVSAAIYKKKHLLLFHRIVSEFLVNDTVRRGVWEKKWISVTWETESEWLSPWTAPLKNIKVIYVPASVSKPSSFLLSLVPK